MENKANTIEVDNPNTTTFEDMAMSAMIDDMGLPEDEAQMMLDDYMDMEMY